MYYSVVILPISDCYAEFYSEETKQLLIELNISKFFHEYIYDWIISNAVDSILKIKHDNKLQYHVADGLLISIYSYIGYKFELMLDNKLDSYKVCFNSTDKIKILIAGETLIISKGKDD